MSAQSAKIEAGQVQATWLDDFRLEMLQFPLRGVTTTRLIAFRNSSTGSKIIANGFRPVTSPRSIGGAADRAIRSAGDGGFQHIRKDWSYPVSVEGWSRENFNKRTSNPTALSNWTLNFALPTRAKLARSTNVNFNCDCSRQPRFP